MWKIDQKKVEESGWTADSIPAMQIAIYVMCGGGHIGRLAAEQPNQFYIDDRVGKLPYPRRAIYQAVATLITIAKINGLNPSKLPKSPCFHNMGIF